MRHEDQDDGDPDYKTVRLLGCTLQQAQIADEQRNFEETDAHLVDRSAGKVHSRVRDDVILRPESYRKSQSISGFWTVASSVSCAPNGSGHCAR